MTRPAKRPQTSHPKVVAGAKAAPGVWVLVRSCRSRYIARSAAQQIESARPRFEMYGPAGAFEARVEDVGDETELSVRYIADTALEEVSHA